MNIWNTSPSKKAKRSVKVKPIEPQASKVLEIEDDTDFSNTNKHDEEKDKNTVNTDAVNQETRSFDNLGLSHVIYERIKNQICKCKYSVHNIVFMVFVTNIFVY